MITLYGRVDVEPVQVRAIFADTDNWPKWMSGIETSQIRSRKQDQCRVSLTQHLQGRSFQQLLECRFHPDRLDLVQLEGNLRRWECTWHFTPSPEDSGTTLSCNIELEIGGLLGMLVSSRYLHALSEQLFDETLRGLEAWARQPETTVTLDEPDTEVLLRLYETEHGLELWLEGRRYLLMPME